MDVYFYIQNHIDWSKKARGDGCDTPALISDSRRQLDNILNLNIDDEFQRWIQIILLGLDGAWRSGADAQDIVSALQMAQNRNILKLQKGNDPYAGEALNAMPDKRK